MYKLLISLLSIFLFSAFSAEGQTVLQGQVSDDREPLICVSVQVSQNGIPVKRVLTDLEGKYSMTLDTGHYEVEFRYTGYLSQIAQVDVSPDKFKLLNIVLESGLDTDMEFICSFGWGPLLFNKDGTEDGQTFRADQLRHMY